MTRGKKVLFSLIALIFATFLFAVLVHYQFVYPLNVYFIKPEDYPIVGSYLPFYLYWGSLIGMVMIALAIIGIVFKPTEVTSIKLSEGNGKLEIKKSAIVGILKAQLSQSDLLKDSKIKVKMYKRKIKVHIFGSTNDNTEVVSQTNQFIKIVDAYIKEFIGLDTAIKTEVVFKNTARSSINKKRKKRVV
ncbi:alkaline shock response membrane anchor protein AmaP [Enterococcus faecalis]|nr:alkaline shock response membrane anchor protein AmaP [Enterococcus faecalis]HCT3382057.1 alkaline shock response membrane anchor protein AmaP [Enterococcus faecalis]